MSDYAMFGLLGGLGRGLANMGENMKKKSLAEAEALKQQNLENIRRQQQLEDQKTKRTWDKEDAAENREFNKDDREAEHAWQKERDEQNFTQSQQQENDRRKWELANRQPSEGDKLLARADKALKEGKITEAEYNNITLGLSKTGGNMTAEERAKLRMDALSQAAKEIRGNDPMQPVTPEETKAINARAAEIFNSVTGETGGAEPPPPGKSYMDILKEGVAEKQQAKEQATPTPEKKVSPVNTGDQLIQEARKRVAQAEATGQQPDPKDLAILTDKEDPTVSPEDRIKDARIKQWKRTHPGEPIPQELLNKGLLE